MAQSKKPTTTTKKTTFGGTKKKTDALASKGMPVTAAKKKTTVPENAVMAPESATFSVVLHQGSASINLNLTRGKAKLVVKAVVKRNLREYPLTVIDIHGIAHTLRNVDRATYNPDLLIDQTKIPVI